MQTKDLEYLKEIEYLDQKSEYVKDLIMESFINLIHNTEEEKKYLENKEFSIFFTKVEAIKDMLLNC